MHTGTEKELQDILHYTAIYRGTQLQQLYMSTIFSELFYDLIHFTFQNFIKNNQFYTCIKENNFSQLNKSLFHEPIYHFTNVCWEACCFFINNEMIRNYNPNPYLNILTCMYTQ